MVKVSTYRPKALTIAVAGIDEVDSLRRLWLALHRHHRAVGNLQPVVDDRKSWPRRRHFYMDRLASNSAFLVVAAHRKDVVGYAMVLLEAGPDDTFPLASRYAELYSLSVLSELRGKGIGTRLLDFVDEELARRDIRDLRVAVMVGNDEARRQYERRGFIPAEVVLYRLGAPAADDPTST